MVAISPVVSEEKLFEIVDGLRTTYDENIKLTKEPAYTISSPRAFGSGELKILAGGRGGDGGVARVSDFQKNPSLKFFFFFFLRGEGKGGLASVSELFVRDFFLQRIQI